MGEDQLVLACERVKLVFGGGEGLARQFRNGLRDFRVEARRSIQAGAHGSAAEGQPAQRGQGLPMK